MKPSSGFAGLVLLAGMAAGTAHAQTYSQFWPYLPDGGDWETFIRHTIVNGSSTLTLVLVNENGQLAGRHELRVDSPGAMSCASMRAKGDTSTRARYATQAQRQARGGH